MVDAARLAIMGAAVCAMGGAVFGVLMARFLWSEDLQHAQKLREIWTRSEIAMRETIEIQRSTINTLKKELGR